MTRRSGAVTFVVCTALFVTAGVVSPANGSSSEGSDTGSWCAAVIRMNTQFGTMKNKRYLPPVQVSTKALRAVITYAAAHRMELLAATPAEIKTAQTHELVYFTHLVVTKFSPRTPLLPYTHTDAVTLLDYQHAHCGIKGP
jgi:hypothetical protein